MPTSITRRDFLAHSGSCAAHLALAAAWMPAAARTWVTTSVGEVVAREPFGNLEKVADGVWALVSTPLSGDRTTLSNGGIIAGRSGVLAIEGFQTPAGAAWLAAKARELTGKWPTHVVLTHYHGDHTSGFGGYFTEAEHPVLRATPRTRDLVLEKNQPDAARIAALKDATMLSAAEPTSIDLGGRAVRVVPRGGHTDSDVSIELDDPSIVFGGDLLWNGMFPNYVDAVPTKLAASVRAMRRAQETIYVPGHGAVARAADYDRYIAILSEVEQAARKARAAGTSAADAGNAFTLPASLGEWTLFSRAFFARAFEAWFKELQG
jgi:glyoxylase-like metal-dependent hydrolase (beta-lactamase superfamily II)